MAKRKALSARTRFEIFKRDGFRCVYCGATPVQRQLQIDHVVPVAGGGDGAASNLVTSCDACNQGKSAVPLERRALEPTKTAEQQRDHAKQILAFLDAQRALDQARAAVGDMAADRWEELIGPMTEEMHRRLCLIVSTWPFDRIEEAMQITARKLGTPGEEFRANQAINQAKYFQGILRRWREEGHP